MVIWWLKLYVYRIIAVNGNRFATCGTDKTVRLWTLREEAIVTDDLSYDVDNDSHGNHYNGTYFCVLHYRDNAITVLDTQGRQVRKIVRKEAFGKGIKFGWDIHMDNAKHNIYVPCSGVNRGVLCLSVEGEPLWLTPLKGSLGGVTEIDGVLCVTDYKIGHGIQMVSKNGKYKGKLLDKDVLKGGNLEYVYYVASEKKIFFNTYNSSDIICFTSV